MDYIIENNFLRLTVSSKGAQMTSLIKKETGEELLWQADPAVWDRSAPILFPYCGRLRDGAFTHKDVVYKGGPHGFARDMEHTLVNRKENEISLMLEANALTMEKYPFAFKLTSTYTLDGCAVRHGVRIENDGEEEMPFSFGFHPGFACPFDARHSAADYVVVMETPETPIQVETGAQDGLVTGKESTYFTNGTQIELTDHLFDADSICLKGLRSKTISLAEKDSGRRVRVRIEAFPYVLLWSAKGPLRFLCIEPWHGLPDARDASGVWGEKPETVHLAPGEKWDTALVMEFLR